MSLPFTSIVSYHTNPMTCGVAKFSAELAKRLGVPLYGVQQDRISRNPLFSLKASELDKESAWRVQAMMAAVDTYGVFWHDSGIEGFNRKASIVFYADPSLGSPGLWCPSLIQPRKRPVRLFSFGMAHKLQTDKYQRVRKLLDAAQQPYHLRVSVGLHEGTSLDGVEKHFDALKAIMGEANVTILGILSDDAVSEELSNADYVLAFFEKGLRANNTTVHAALAADCKVVTNHDADTPVLLCLATTDVGQFDTDAPDWFIRHREYSWDRLIEAIRRECDKSRSQIA